MIVTIINENKTTLSYTATLQVKCAQCNTPIPQGRRYTRKDKKPYCQGCRPFEKSEEDYIAQVRRANKLIEKMAQPR